MTNNKINLTEDGGVRKDVVRVGEGVEMPTYGQAVTIHYIGKLTNGIEFDSSVERNNPFEFILGKGSVIPAFERCVQTMKLREKCILTCSPDYAYGAVGSPPSIPPNATLIFEMEMLGWKGEDVSPDLDGSIERYIIIPSEKRRKPHWEASVKAHLCGKFNNQIFEDREVLFNYGEGSDLNIVKGVEAVIGKMRIGETSKFIIKSKHAFGTSGHRELGIPPNADVTYVIKLIDCEKGVDEWKWSNEERIQQAKLYKEKGTTYFNKNNFSLAIKMYEKVVAILESVDKEATANDVTTLKIAAYNNCALCHQKLNNQFEGKKACDEVLKLDPNNIKALYRRGQCNLATSDLVEAMNDFRKVGELDLSNKAVLNQILICKSKIKECNAREKKLYGNMFQRMAVTFNEPACPEADILSKCGEWSEEATRREADLAFERDDIVMI